MPPLLPPTQLDLSSLIKLISEGRQTLVQYDKSLKSLDNPQLGDQYIHPQRIRSEL